HRDMTDMLVAETGLRRETVFGREVPLARSRTHKQRPHVEQQHRRQLRTFSAANPRRAGGYDRDFAREHLALEPAFTRINIGEKRGAAQVFDDAVVVGSRNHDLAGSGAKMYRPHILPADGIT